MNRLVALVFDDPYKAEEARAAVHRMGGEGLLEIDETALIIKQQDGNMRVSQDVDMVSKNQRAGNLCGLAAAAVTGTMPFILVGTSAARLLGLLTDHNVTNRFIKQVTNELQPGTSSLLIYARSDPERRQRVIERLQAFNPKLLESDMPPELEQELEAGLKAEQRAA